MTQKITLEEEKKITSKCNKILYNYEDLCQCYDNNNNPSNNLDNCSKNNSKKCNEYNLFKKYFKSKMSGSEPKYNPDNWNHPLIKNSHNCYTYFLNDHNSHTIKQCKEICKKK